jgi:adenylate cyclase class 2
LKKIYLFYQEAERLVHAGILRMLEIEAKYPVSEIQSLETNLRRLGAEPVEERTDADHYYNAPDRDFAQTDEAFRVRRIGERNLLTYKGPKIDRQTKTRREIEVAFADGAGAADDLQRLLTHLGYKPVAVVHKKRRVYELVRDGFTMHFCIDQVENVGTYAEIEIMAEHEKLEAAKAVLQQAAADLGLTTTERRSYLELLLTRTGRGAAK